MLWQARRRAGLTAAAVGRLIGSSDTHVHLLEREEYRPNETTAARLALALPLTDWERAVLGAFAVPDAAMRSRKPRPERARASA
jgi:DNA-binding XRE family transcriptional regulator